MVDTKTRISIMIPVRLKIPEPMVKEATSAINHEALLTTDSAL
jgi:hypothetical protein